MTYHAFKTTTLILSLSQIELEQAARLGGLPNALDNQDGYDPDTGLELTRFVAKRGIAKAIKEAHERHFPARYPEDVEPNFWAVKSAPQPITGQFGHIWKGKVSW